MSATSLSLATAKQILVVDDDKPLRSLLAQVLREKGYHVQTEADGDSALKVLSSNAWDLVITDRNMPEMNGIDLADEIKRREPRTPILLITGYTDQIFHTRSFDAIMAKPFSAGAFLATISNILQRDQDSVSET